MSLLFCSFVKIERPLYFYIFMFLCFHCISVHNLYSVFVLFGYLKTMTGIPMSSTGSPASMIMNAVLIADYFELRSREVILFLCCRSF